MIAEDPLGLNIWTSISDMLAIPRGRIAKSLFPK